MIALSGWYWLWGGSWNIIGWLCLLVLVSAFSLFAYILLSTLLRNISYDVRRAWENHRCKHGHHGPDFIMDREARSWYDEETFSYVNEITRFKKCSRCWKRIEGSEVTEAKTKTSRFDIQRRGF